MAGIYSLDVFLTGCLIGFFLAIGFSGQDLVSDLSRKTKKPGISRLYSLLGKLAMLLWVLLGIYIIYTRQLIFVSYFAGLLAGGLVGQAIFILLVFFGFVGRLLLCFIGFLAAPATAYIIWLYYSSLLVNLFSKAGILHYLPSRIW